MLQSGKLSFTGNTIENSKFLCSKCCFEKQKCFTQLERDIGYLGINILVDWDASDSIESHDTIAKSWAKTGGGVDGYKDFPC